MGCGGGIIIYARIDLICSELDYDEMDKFNQAAGLKIISEKTTFNIIVVYRPHRIYNNSSYSDNEQALINLIRNAPRPFIIIGDFNCNEINWEILEGSQRTQGFLDVIEEKFISQHVDFAMNNNGSILDLVLSSKQELVAGTENLGPIDMSDHHAIKITTGITTRNEIATVRHNWKRANIVGIK